MKNRPLWLQIWIVIAAITLSIFLLLSFVLPSTLRSFFTKEVYASIDAAQDLVFNQFSGDIYRDYLGPDFFGENNEILNNIRTVNHIILYNNKAILDSSVPKAFLNEARDQAFLQEEISKEYTGNIGKQKIFYIITKGKALGENAYLISFMGDSYREDLVDTLFTRLTLLMGFILIFSWAPSILLSRYISKPLVDLEKKVERLANNQWDQPVNILRKDEIGKLGDSIEHLRKQLIRQDEAEQSFLQHVSHELKTPVMVIRSFTQSIKDGIYPKGDLDSSIVIIDEEAERLERKVKNLLYLTKLDYLSNHELDNTPISLDRLINEVIDKTAWQNPNIKWTLDLIPINILGDPDQWKVVIENLIDNQIRYAKNNIEISLKQSNDNTYLRIWNDGPKIEDNLINNLFNKFDKGHKGEFGLGLAIVDRVLKNHNSKIYAINEENGVSFTIEI